MTTRIHPTAIIEDDVTIGDGTSIWDNVHIRHGATIGEQCIVGEKTYIAYDVVIGDRVKINAMVYICTAVTIEDGVMISAGTVFTNDRFPRATTPNLKELRPSEPDEDTLPTLVKEGATIGAGCTIGNDLSIGRFAMVGHGVAGHQVGRGLPPRPRPPGAAGRLRLPLRPPAAPLRRDGRPRGGGRLLGLRPPLPHRRAPGGGARSPRAERSHRRGSGRAAAGPSSVAASWA